MITGKWDVVLKAMGNNIKGHLDFDAMEASVVGDTFPITELTQKRENIFTFVLSNGDGKRINFTVTVNDNTITGKAKFASIPVGFVGQKA